MIFGYNRSFLPSGPPSGNLTARWDASDTTKVWNVLNTASNPCWATQATDGQLARVWQSIVPGVGVETPLVREVIGREPVYRVASSPMLLSSILFSDTDNDNLVIRSRIDSSFAPITAYLGLSAKTILMSLQIHTSTAVGYILQIANSDAFGIYVAQSSGDKIVFFNRDPALATNLHSYSLNTNYVIMMRHDGVNLKSSLNGGAETSVASGASSFSDASLRIGSNGALAVNMSVGEILFYNSYLTGADLTAALDYMINKWI